jgi:hypothetical protein
MMTVCVLDRACSVDRMAFAQILSRNGTPEMKMMRAFLLVLSFLGSSVAAQQPITPGTDSTRAPFTSIESIAAVVPSSIRLKTDGKWSIVGVEQANEAVKAKALNRPARLRLKVQVFQPFKEHGWGYRIMAPDDRVPILGTRIGYRIWAYFRPDQAEALSKVKAGSSIVLSGTLGRADIQMFGDRPGLSLDLYEAKVEKQ